MNFAEYQEKAFSTCTPACYTEEYLNLGYIEEVGELAGKLAKRVRGDAVTDADVMKEIGDCAWMAAVRERLQDRKLKDWMEYPYWLSSKIECIRDLSRASESMSFFAVKAVCEFLGYDFGTCLQMNLDKLADRKSRGVISGDGDNR